jgi:hypothetical protein
MCAIKKSVSDKSFTQFRINCGNSNRGYDNSFELLEPFHVWEDEEEKYSTENVCTTSQYYCGSHIGSGLSRINSQRGIHSNFSTHICDDGFNSPDSCRNEKNVFSSPPSSHHPSLTDFPNVTSTMWDWSPNSKPEKIGQRLKSHTTAWTEIKCERHIINGVMPQWLDERKGKESLARERRPFPFHGSERVVAQYRKLLNEELSEGIVVPVPDNYVKWWNPTFLVPKKNGEYRKVLNCRKLNSKMKDLHFKMEEVKTVKDVILQGDYAVSIDIKSAYNHVSVHPSLRPYLCFLFQG